METWPELLVDLLKSMCLPSSPPSSSLRSCWTSFSSRWRPHRRFQAQHSSSRAAITATNTAAWSMSRPMPPMHVYQSINAISSPCLCLASADLVCIWKRPLDSRSRHHGVKSERKEKMERDRAPTRQGRARTLTYHASILVGFKWRLIMLAARRTFV